MTGRQYSNTTRQRFYGIPVQRLRTRHVELRHWFLRVLLSAIVSSGPSVWFGMEESN